MPATLTQVFKNPMRVRILELLARDASLSSEAAPLTNALREFFPKVKQKQVAYHLSVLKEAKMLTGGRR